MQPSDRTMDFISTPLPGNKINEIVTSLCAPFRRGGDLRFSSGFSKRHFLQMARVRDGQVYPLYPKANREHDPPETRLVRNGGSAVQPPPFGRKLQHCC